MKDSHGLAGEPLLGRASTEVDADAPRLAGAGGDLAAVARYNYHGNCCPGASCGAWLTLECAAP